MKLSDFTGTKKLNLEELEVPIDTEIEEPEQPSFDTGPKIADIYNRIMEREAQNEAIEAKRVAYVVDPIISSSLTAKAAVLDSAFNTSVSNFKDQLDNIAIVTTQMLEIVRKYQKLFKSLMFKLLEIS